MMVLDISTLQALGAALFFGTGLVLTNIGFRWTGALQGGMVSISTTAILFLVLSPFVVDWQRSDATGAMIFAAIGLFYPAIVNLLTFEGNQRVGPSITGAVGNMTPLFAVLAAIAFLGEAPGLVQVIAIVVILIGVSLITISRGRGAAAGWALVALMFPLVAAVIRGLAQPFVKVGLEFWASPFAAITVSYIVSALLLFTVCSVSTAKPLKGLERRGIAWFVLVGLCHSAANLLFYRALVDASVTVVAPLVASYPIATLILSRLLIRGTQIPWSVVLGVVVTVGGVVLLLVG